MNNYQFEAMQELATATARISSNGKKQALIDIQLDIWDVTKERLPEPLRDELIFQWRQEIGLVPPVNFDIEGGFSKIMY
jgi:hypothetical protein